jgi:hypothetical protein
VPQRGRIVVVSAAAAFSALACQLLTIPGLPEFPAPPASTVPTVAPATHPPTATRLPLSIPPTIVIPPAAEVDPAQALLPEFASDADQFPDQTRYWIDTAIEFVSGELRATLRGQARLRYVVPEGETIDSIPLMLWPNDPQYDSVMTAGPALVNGTLVEGETDLGGIVLWLSLTEPAGAGDVLDISLPFEIEAGGPIGGFAPKRFGITEGVLAAPTAYPLVPRRIDGAWQVETAPPGGDTTNSDIASYQVDLTVPEDLALAASGVAVESIVNGDGTVTARYLTGPMRDFAFALGPFQSSEDIVDGVVVRAWALPEHSQDADEMLDAATRQLGILNDLIGPYPYVELDVVDVPGAFGGIEYPGIVFIGTLGTSWLVEPTVHEVAHQWFYGLIGDDQLHEPWLDEALATYAEVLYYEEIGQRGAAAGLLSQFRSWVRSHPDPTLPIGRGVGEYPDPDAYALFVYGKGALFLDALRGEIGEEAFDEFLRIYFEQQRYGFATGEEFQQSAETACGCDLDALFDLWVWVGGEIPGI